MQSFNRPNLKFEVRQKNEKTHGEIVRMLAQQYKSQSGIIYCLSKNDCDVLAKKLCKDGLKVAAYHAGLSFADRKKVQEDWINERCHVVVATTAFGMGIDKANVRFVIHETMPSSFEGYYQEVGRGGRDGSLAVCILFFSSQDFTRWKTLLTKTNQGEMLKVSIGCLCDVLNFCVNKIDCRRAQVLKYLGENFDRRDCLKNFDAACDNCLSKDNYKEEDFTIIAKKILLSIGQLVGSFSSTCKERISSTQLVDILCGKLLYKVVNVLAITYVLLFQAQPTKLFRIIIDELVFMQFVAIYNPPTCTVLFCS